MFGRQVYVRGHYRRRRRHNTGGGLGLLVLLMLLIGILYFFSTYPVVTFILLGLFVLAVCWWIWLRWRTRHRAMLRLQAVEAQRLGRDRRYIPADVRAAV